MTTIGSRVKQRRNELGLTQQQLAERMGYVSKGSIAQIECGRDPTSKVVIKLADALHTSPVWLMGWTDDVRPLHDTRMQRIMNELYKLNFSQLNQIEKIIQTFVETNEE